MGYTTAQYGEAAILDTPEAKQARAILDNIISERVKAVDKQMTETFPERQAKAVETRTELDSQIREWARPKKRLLGRQKVS